MTAGFLPDFSPSNPYQALLAGALAAEGVHVRTLRLHAPRHALRALRTVDVIHLHWPQNLILGNPVRRYFRLSLFVVLLLLAKLLGKKIIWTVHNIYCHDDGSRASGRILLYVLVGLMDAGIVHSETGRQRVEAELKVFKERARSRFEIVPHGLYDTHYARGLSREDARSQLGITDEQFVFLSLGQIKAYKDLPLVVRAFRQLPASEFRLWIAGSCSRSDLLEELTALAGDDSRIRIEPRRLSDAEVCAYLTAADVFVLSYRDICTSGALFLGLTFGKSLVAPRLGEIPEVLGPEYPLLYQPGAPEDLAAKMALSYQQRREKFVTAADQVEAQRGWAKIAKATAAIYRR